MPTSAPTEPASLSEEQFLSQKLAEAQRAMSITMHRLRRDVRKGASPKAWVKKRPKSVAIGAGAVAGAVTLGVLMKKYRKPALPRRSWSDNLSRGNGHSRGRYRASDRSAVPAAFGRIRPGKLALVMQLASQAVRLLKPAIISFLTASAKAAATRPQPPVRADLARPERI